MPRKKFDLIVFDWDGTLMDSTTAIIASMQAAARDLGVTVPDKRAASYVIGLGLQDALQAAVPDLDPRHYPKMAERYRHHYLSQDHQLTLFAGAREMLDDLVEQGYFLAVATGKSRVGRNRAPAAAGVSSFFEVTRCADDTFSQPNPALLLGLTCESDQASGRTGCVGRTQ